MKLTTHRSDICTVPFLATVNSALVVIQQLAQTKGAMQQPTKHLAMTRHTAAMDHQAMMIEHRGATP